jgi:putative phosphoribosyl transferase
LRAPDSAENSIGAIMQDSSLYLDPCTVQSLGVSDEYIQTEKRGQKKKIEKMTELYDRPKSREYKIKGRTVFLVDDGAATGATIIAAARWIRKQEPWRLIIAVPVAPSQVVMMLRNEADAVEAIRSPSASEFASFEQFIKTLILCLTNASLQYWSVAIVCRNAPYYYLNYFSYSTTAT